MGLFVCDKCDVIENTALGLYWGGSNHNRWFGIPDHSALCSACMPTHFVSGTVHRDGKGKWHNRFKRRLFSDNPDVPVKNRP